VLVDVIGLEAERGAIVLFVPNQHVELFYVPCAC
jgi:hypothetical protein